MGSFRTLKKCFRGGPTAIRLGNLGGNRDLIMKASTGPNGENKTLVVSTNHRARSHSAGVMVLPTLGPGSRPFLSSVTPFPS